MSFSDDMYRKTGIRPKMHDPLRMGKRTRKGIAIATLALGALVLPLYGNCVAVAKGQQRIEFYSKTKDEDGKFKFYVLGATAFLNSGTSFTKSTLLPGWFTGQIEAIGAGGNGGTGGPGANGGAYVKGTNVGLPNGTINYVIGTAGAATTLQSTLIVAAGGNTAPASQAANSRGGNGGGILNPGASFFKQGGSGNAGDGVLWGGGGGGGAGSTGNGGNATVSARGAAGTGTVASGQAAGQGGTSGGNGIADGSPGGAGSIYGGGGGGGSPAGCFGAGGGGAGAQGCLSFSWTAAIGQPNNTLFIKQAINRASRF